jgi:cytidylate kinase
MGSGKSTVAKAVAQRLGLRHLDTGAMYRSVALACLRASVNPRDAEAVGAIAERLTIDFRPGPDGNRVIVDGEDVTDAVREPAVSEVASIVSTVARVRTAMVARQRELGRAGGVVMEGRDIGTVVFPDADVKVFLDASPEARAQRRYEELRKKDPTVRLDDVLRAQADRDRRDSTRSLSPLRPAADAVVVDSTAMTAEQAIEAVLRLVQQRASD